MAHLLCCLSFLPIASTKPVTHKSKPTISHTVFIPCIFSVGLPVSGKVAGRGWRVEDAGGCAVNVGVDVATGTVAAANVGVDVAAGTVVAATVEGVAVMADKGVGTGVVVCVGDTRSGA